MCSPLGRCRLESGGGVQARLTNAGQYVRRRSALSCMKIAVEFLSQGYHRGIQEGEGGGSDGRFYRTGAAMHRKMLWIH